MIPINIKKLFAKDARKLLRHFGGLYIILSIGAIFMLFLQDKILTATDNSVFPGSTKSTNLLYDIWIVFMPGLFIIGLGYLFISIFYKKLRMNRLRLHITLSVTMLVWFVSYCIACFDLLGIANQGLPQDFPYFNYIFYFFAAFGFVGCYFFFVHPQWIIYKKIKAERVS